MVKKYISGYLLRKGEQMNTTLKTDITVNDICEGFVYNELEGKGLFEIVELKFEVKKSNLEN